MKKLFAMFRRFIGKETKEEWAKRMPKIMDNNASYKTISEMLASDINKEVNRYDK